MINPENNRRPGFLNALINKYQLRSISKKLVLLCALLIIIPYLLYSSITVRSFSEELMDRHAYAMEESVKSGSELLKSYLSNIKGWTLDISENISFVNLLTSRGSQQMFKRLRLDGAINRIFTRHSEVLSLKSLTLFDGIRTRISRTYAYYTYNWSTLEAFCLQNGISLGNLLQEEFVVIPMGIPKNAWKAPYFGVAWGIKSNDEQLLHMIYAEIDLNVLTNLYPRIELLKNEVILLMNSDGGIIYQTGNENGTHYDLPAVAARLASSMKTTGIFTHEGVEYRLFMSAPFLNGLRVVRFLPNTAFKSVIVPSQQLMMTVTLISLSISIAVLIAIVYSFTQPLRKLSDSMIKMGEGEFGVILSTDKADAELIPVIEQFNEMSLLIHKLFHETFQSKLEQQRAELKALQAQINPHFLYNTLQTVHFLALKHNALDVCTIIDSLGNFLRYCFEENDSCVALDIEISNTIRYLTIQKVRFRQRLNFSVSASDESKKAIVPKMILQPLVENSVIHAMQNTDLICNIKINCAMINETVFVSVSDTGPGIPKTKLNEIMERLENCKMGDTHDSIGLVNCYLRINYFYQNQAIFKIDSEIGQGTTIQIAFPAQLEAK